MVLRAEVVVRDTVRQIVRPDSIGIRCVDLDLLDGSVEVIGSDRSDVILVAVRRTRAVTTPRITRAGDEVRLLVRKIDDRVVVYADAPWRTHYGTMGRRMSRFGFDVSYDLRVEVPRSAEVSLQTRGEGDVYVRGVTGSVAVANVAGNVNIEGLRAPAWISSVSGDMRVTFDAVPEDDCEFSSVSGEIETVFPAPLNAVLCVYSQYGDVFTDFPFALLPRQPVRLEEENGWRRYRGDTGTRVAVGTAGPELSFRTHSGPITILQRQP
jgi:hypothetical protein